MRCHIALTDLFPTKTTIHVDKANEMENRGVALDQGFLLHSKRIPSYNRGIGGAKVGVLLPPVLFATALQSFASQNSFVHHPLRVTGGSLNQCGS
jgi:hypothetical protein